MCWIAQSAIGPQNAENASGTRPRIAATDSPGIAKMLVLWLPLTALLLAYNLFGDGFLEASCRLGGKTAGHFLRIFKHIERI